MKTLLTSFAVFLALVATAAAQTWTPPIGIPAPPFGVTDARKASSPWSDEVAGSYYVDRTQPTSTDSGNAFGYPGRPRLTVPQDLPAGSYVEIHGGGYATPDHWTMNGTDAAPVFVYGIGTAKPDFTGSQTELQLRGQWFVVDGLKFSNTKIRFGQDSGSDVHHAALRHFELTGWRGISTTSMIGFAAPLRGHHDNVIYDAEIHDNGPLVTSTDVDQHGIGISAFNTRFWLLDSRLYRNTGDGIQINAGSAANEPTTNHIYVGRNVAYGNRQNGFWTKQAVDVIFSENTSYSHRPSVSSPGACLGFQYAPDRVWFIYNHLYDCTYGIYSGSDNGLGTGVDTYFIGNVIHNIHITSGTYNANDSNSPAAIMLRGGQRRNIVNNTIHDVDAGIGIPGGTGGVRMVNNILSGITQANDIFLESPGSTNGSTMNNNLLSGGGRIRWGGQQMNDLSGFQRATGLGAACRTGDPRFVDAARADFHTSAGSPAIDGGTADSVYDVFQRLYGLSIAIGRDGRARPAGAAYDMGAYETGAEGAAGPPHPPESLHILR